ncbi:MAG: hypothetical protein FJ303_01285 [Planctomycetes bacterium]|nr:hypothetical protein [Planctomycetota bacterium]
MSTNPPKVWKYLAPDPKPSSYKQLCVRGTRIRARTLYGLCFNSEPMTPEEAALDYNVPVEAVLESIEYCQSNPPELLADYARQKALMDAVAASPNGRLSPQEIAQIKRMHRA